MLGSNENFRKILPLCLCNEEREKHKNKNQIRGIVKRDNHIFLAENSFIMARLLMKSYTQ